jgi:hypothetical protein
MRVIAYALISGTSIYFLVVPLARRTSDHRFALYVEEQAPELRQALLSAVHELHAPVADRASPSLSARLIARTVTALRPLQTDGRIERPRMVRASRSLGAVLVIGTLLMMLGPSGLRHTARALFAPWSIAEAATPVMAVRVVPGDAAVPKGASVDVGASITGFASDSAELVFRVDTTAPWTRLPMSRDKVAGSFTSRLFDVARPTEYFVESNGVRSAHYRLTVSNLPAITKLALDIHYPAYTGIPQEHVDDGGDVATVVGTMVTVRPLITMPVRSGTLTFDNGSTVPLVPGPRGSLAASFRVTTSGFYRVDLVSTVGASVLGPVQYAVDALPDRTPTVSIEQPGRDTKVTNVEEVTVAVRASDDYGVESMELRYRVNGGEEKRVPLASGARHSKEPRGTYTFFLEEEKLAPGDLIAYNAIASDGAGNVGSSDVYFLEVRPFGKNYRQAEQQGGGGGGGGGDSPDGFVPRQRDVVAGTFNWLRDSVTSSARKRREDVATLHIAEGSLRADVEGLTRRLEERGATRADTMFVHIHAELTQAIASLQAAEELLVKGLGRAALPAEQQALQRLQRAEALYRDVQVQLGQQGGGGGGGGGGAQQRPEDLADLFELQTDKLRNQYEAVQSESQQPEQSAQREANAALEKLKELARRQQQENERMQRLAEAMRERLGREQSASGGGGGGASQRELARQAEEEARRLERLAREKSSPELAQAAQQLQRAADAMRKAATGSPAQGAAALNQLGRAASGLEGARSDRVGENVRQLAQRARAIENRQREIASEVKSAGAASAEQRAERLRQLTEKKDSLATDVEQLEANADRVSRDGRREQPSAAGKVGEAADAIRDQRIRDKIAFSKNVMRGASTEYTNALEEQISSNLADVAERMRAAAGALGAGTQASPQGKQRALDQARELVRGLESLRDQIADGSTVPSGNANGRPTATQGDPRQLSRAFGLRRGNAEALRRELARQGVDVRQLDQAIEQLRRLESGRGTGDPRGVEQLQSSVIEGLKDFEFALARALGEGQNVGPALGSRSPVPEEYRAAIEEYYRSLAGGRREK